MSDGKTMAPNTPAASTRDHAVKAGEPLKVWVDRNGNRVDAPAPTSQAGVDAVCVAYGAWQTVALAVAGSLLLGPLAP